MVTVPNWRGFSDVVGRRQRRRTMPMTVTLGHVISAAADGSPSASQRSEIRPGRTDCHTLSPPPVAGRRDGQPRRNAARGGEAWRAPLVSKRLTTENRPRRSCPPRQSQHRRRFVHVRRLFYRATFDTASHVAYGMIRQSRKSPREKGIFEAVLPYPIASPVCQTVGDTPTQDGHVCRVSVTKHAGQRATFRAVASKTGRMCHNRLLY